MEGWPYTASCLDKLGESDPAGVMDGRYCLPCRTVPVALTEAAQLLADGISSCWYSANVRNHPSWLQTRMAGKHGTALHANSSLALAVQMRGRLRLSSFQPYADAQKVEKWYLGLVVRDKNEKTAYFLLWLCECICWRKLGEGESYCVCVEVQLVSTVYMKGQIVRPNKPANAKYRKYKDDLSYTSLPYSLFHV